MGRVKSYCEQCDDLRVFVRKRVRKVGDRRVLVGKCFRGHKIMKIIKGPGGK